ncbi:MULTISPECIES: aminotransferase class I/II-fold pyridoxal phosphate-dependent enzyme [unclassified Streptomyces]|uniref:aminotransferase class I/II-fold pyridoxal phosphate-dependent enzyme n=1 Tax=unclassified Streptomyces TaxID=2593676 RepID=UPI00036AF223|nr:MULTISPECIES: aminotransferase class I/II-fold pyridoxal phosphate-dependent enzyme [unclassified Streptomyces]MYT30295.1 aminotransferase class I/II-fold pyridoxal phosphate-dependent enzyme [Streptomyces sp. SID8354]
MQRTAPDPQREPDPAPPVGLPVLPELAAHLSAAADRAAPEPPGGSLPLRTAACGYWERRGLFTPADRVLAAPGAAALLLALYAATEGAVLLTRPCAEWYAPPARLLGRPVHVTPVPAESGGLPDPFALLETVRRARMHGDTPRLLVLSVVDDPTGTCPPPEQLHEVCEAAAEEGLWVVSDESRRDLLHDPHDTVVLSPAEMLPGEVVVLTDLRAALLPASWPAALARFPGTRRGALLRDAVCQTLARLYTPLAGPLAHVVTYALGEPDAVRERTATAARVYGALTGALHHTLTGAGALCRPPHAGSHLYADLERLRRPLGARGIAGSAALERELARWAARGGHRFEDDPDALRVRLGADALLGVDMGLRQRVLEAADPLELPHVREGLRELGWALAELGGGASGPADGDGPGEDGCGGYVAGAGAASGAGAGGGDGVWPDGGPFVGGGGPDVEGRAGS